MTLEKIWVGIDVSQDLLDVYRLPQGLSLQQPNNEAGIAALTTQFLSFSPTLVVVESTGGLERAIVLGLQTALFPVAIANPRTVKGFAIALGKAKTDKLDAQVIARFAQSVQPQPQPPVTPSAQQLSDLVRRRHQLVEMQVAEKNRLSRAAQTVQADIKLDFEPMTDQPPAISPEQLLTLHSESIARHEAFIAQHEEAISRIEATLAQTAERQQRNSEQLTANMEQIAANAVGIPELRLLFQDFLQSQQNR